MSSFIFMPNNPKLKIVPLQEVVFEIRYEGFRYLQFADISNRFKEAIKVDFPIFEDLYIPEVPIEIPEAFRIVRQRFYNPEKTRIVQLGLGVFTLNHTAYDGYESFLKDLNKIWALHREITQVEKINRVGLRYINRFSAEDKPILNIDLKLPEVFNARRASNLVVLQDSGLDKIKTNINIVGDSILLDIDYFKEGEGLNKIDELLVWIEKAHIQIYERFTSALDSEFFKYLSEGHYD